MITISSLLGTTKVHYLRITVIKKDYGYYNLNILSFGKKGAMIFA